MGRLSTFVVRATAIALALTSSVGADSNKGEKYFHDEQAGNCKSCHYTDGRRLVGPGLRGVTERHSGEWLRSFLQDPQQTWSSDHPETLELKQRVRKKRAKVTTCKKQPMDAEGLQDLIEYLQTF